jgi:hypothetical protein
MNTDPKVGFQLQTIQVPVNDLLPLREVKEPQKIMRYRAILVSIKEVGMIEPLMVYPQKDTAGKYIILDGHLRWHALKELGQAEADCILARDDECFTYNARVSRITPVQEHRMIVKAINHGVSPERVAAALNIPVRVVKAFLNLLKGIHDEVAEMLKDKNISPRAIKLLRRVNGVRQIAIAELMVASENYTNSYVEALILGTPPDQLAKAVTTKKRKGFSREKIARLEDEMATLEREFKSVEKSYGQNVLHLTLASTYLRSLLNHPVVARFLSTQHPGIFAEFDAIAKAESL